MLVHGAEATDMLRCRALEDLLLTPKTDDEAHYKNIPKLDVEAPLHGCSEAPYS